MTLLVNRRLCQRTISVNSATHSSAINMNDAGEQRVTKTEQNRKHSVFCQISRSITHCAAIPSRAAGFGRSGLSTLGGKPGSKLTAHPPLCQLILLSPRTLYPRHRAHKPSGFMAQVNELHFSAWKNFPSTNSITASVSFRTSRTEFDTR